ncbi:hypothetical protein GE061_015275 [Apolygus lucorum]|uniref:Uncharacterized protein n=1 Tax=Apolygus lucorum TaxID=248454 RepID=A0A8S9XKM1_APOLU|nr:hypothetical protein GE061_015275 [Apolygus lucorum]
MMADQALDKGNFKITEGISIVKSPDAVPGDGAPRSLSPDDIQKQDIFSLVINRAERFLKTHTFKFDLKGSEVIDAVSNGARALGDATDALGLTEEEEGEGEESARRKVKKAGKMLLPLLIMLKMKAAALIPVALGAIALIAGKALLIGKIALLLSGIIALKKLLSGHQNTTAATSPSAAEAATSEATEAAVTEAAGVALPTPLRTSPTRVTNPKLNKPPPNLGYSRYREEPTNKILRRLFI